MITFFTASNSFIYITFYELIGRREFFSLSFSVRRYLISITAPNIAVYSNSFMATLNARKSLRDGSSAGGELSLSLQNVAPSSVARPFSVRPSVSLLPSTSR